MLCDNSIPYHWITQSMIHYICCHHTSIDIIHIMNDFQQLKKTHWLYWYIVKKRKWWSHN